ncbi:hypothetical protein I6F43_15760 [Pseudoalteromonas sp. NZS71_1]|uniref:DUF2326 domain-containing protein n=1 Tax=Pseudoalteromonas sp. NZS71_1 TaxID=2792072 RepID=UPI0018CFA6A6|nr:DUF2326 domain-containing protein [Pseudoalteromonas sp. NZS71_1]MBH0036106.1 hypothetical protein [Pseudoalteromonas sp. NZS71_1]
MLKELRCNQLIKSKLEFSNGLNALVGADDGTNSIGKSSVLMLIDFALSGDDFIKLCSDVIEHVGTITVEMDFIFSNQKYSFSRSTNDPEVVQYLSEKDKPEKSISIYRAFLSEYYSFPEGAASFRSAVNPFFRIWGKDNNNPNRPLNSFPNEPYSKIKPNILKLFSFYSAVKDLEKEKKKTDDKSKILKGAFDEGYLQSLNKREINKSEKKLLEVEAEIATMKASIESFSINANQIINDENLKLKSTKDGLVSSLFQTKNRLNRIENNLKYGNTINKKNFEKLSNYFPDVDGLKLAKVDQFHSGVTKILKAELRNEKDLLEEKIRLVELDINDIDKKLISSLSMLDKPSGIVDKLLELSVEEKELRDQLRFRDLKSIIDTKSDDLSNQVTQKLVTSLSNIEDQLNLTMSKYIGKFYEGSPVNPKISFSETRYDFSHNDDSGTGKAFANMIAMDMSFLEKTYLPILIHDLIVFSNIEDHALEEIFNTYTTTKKQAFIAIDKLSRFNKQTQKLVLQNKFLALDSENLAFNESWKNK